jgi:hypothetical protein
MPYAAHYKLTEVPEGNNWAWTILKW